MSQARRGVQKSDAHQAAAVASKTATLQRLLSVALADIVALVEEREETSGDAAGHLDAVASACESARLVAQVIQWIAEDACIELTEIAACPRARLSSPVPATHSSTAHRPARVLLIENDQFTCDVLTTLLDMVDVTADIAGDGAEGIRKLSQVRFDAAIVDVTLPRSGGVDVARNIREISPKMPIALVIGDPEYLHAISGSGFECQVLIRKPIRSDELFKAVDSLLACASEVG